MRGRCGRRFDDLGISAAVYLRGPVGPPKPPFSPLQQCTYMAGSCRSHTKKFLGCMPTVSDVWWLF